MKDVKVIIDQFVATNNLKTLPVTNAMTAEKVTENTQASIDALTSIGQYLSTMGQTNTLDTTFHDQFDTHLCHSYAIISAFRQVIRDLISSSLQRSTSIKQIFSKIKNKLANKQPINMKEIEGNFSFHRLLTAFVTGVNPRSFAGLSTRQSANTETAVFRLINRTAFEIEGWKKMIPVRDFFNSAGLKVCSYNSIQINTAYLK